MSGGFCLFCAEIYEVLEQWWAPLRLHLDTKKLGFEHQILLYWNDLWGQTLGRTDSGRRLSGFAHEKAPLNEGWLPVTSSSPVTAENSGVTPRSWGLAATGSGEGAEPRGYRCRVLPTLLCPRDDPASRNPRPSAGEPPGPHPAPPPGNGAVSSSRDLTSSRASVSGTRRFPPLPLLLLGGRRRPPGGEWGRAARARRPPHPVRAEGRGGGNSLGAVARREGVAQGESTVGGGERVSGSGSGSIPTERLRASAGPGGLSAPSSARALPACPVAGFALRAPQPCPGTGARGCPDSWALPPIPPALPTRAGRQRAELFQWRISAGAAARRSRPVRLRSASVEQHGRMNPRLAAYPA